jgi:putative pyoverdin transport system ATP-binding/permease protein
MVRAGRFFDLTREHWDGWFNGLKALTEGTKELKLHRERRRGFLADGLGRPLNDMLDSAMAGNAYATAAASFGQVVSFVLIGIVVFFLPRITPLDDRALTGYALTILYMVGPLESIMNLVPSYRRAQTAVNKVEQLGLSLAAEEGGEVESEEAPNADWRRLSLAGVTHTYRDEASQDSFILGPVDLELRKGQVVFLVGGNGSGKTTLAKLLLGLYVPEAGQVLLDGQAVGDAERDAYRQLFTAIFSDFFLFESFFGLQSSHLEEDAGRYLDRLQLTAKVGVEQGALSTLDLSQGQRKRLALLIAFLEDRSIYLFDEWAADQDPYFKEVFYRELLPELQQRGKTVVVISHDDRYFHLGDRLVKMESGRIVYDGEPVSPEAAVAAVAVGTHEPAAEVVR